MTVSNPSLENELNDLQDVETDISNLFNEFISPIDKIRSISRPGSSPSIIKKTENVNSIIRNDFQNVQIDHKNPLESRTHAFYRMLGLPSVAPDGSFYNSGFNPAGSKNLERQQNINIKIFNSGFQNIIIQREQLITDNAKIFQKQDLKSSLYALIMRHQGPFNIINPDISSFAADNQTVNIDNREAEIQKINIQNPTLNILNFSPSSKYTHILRPFIVDPRMEQIVMPDNFKICVPFLKKKSDTKISNNTFLLRPGLELIIRNRLSNDDNISISNTDINNFNDVIGDVNINNFSSIQRIHLSRLIKLIRVCVNEINISNRVIDQAKKDIGWFPIPGPSGPIAGPLGASLNRSNINMSVLESRISELTIRKLNAEKQLSEQPDIGEFASPFNSNLIGKRIALYEDQLKDLIQQRNGISDRAFEGLANIESITGEVAGLGLIDIFAIYIALWSMSLPGLLGLLDTDSFQRLKNDSSFKTQATNFGQSDIFSAYKEMENIIINTFNFADGLKSQIRTGA